MPTLQYEDRDVYYQDIGAGSAVLLIPGLGGQLSFWSSVTRALKGDFRVLSFDHPGCGASDAPTQTVTIKNLAQLCLALLENLQIEKVQLVGHSMGGAIAQHLALNHSHRITRVVLSSTWDQPDLYLQRAFGQRLEIMRELGIEAYARAQTLSIMSAEFIASNPDLVKAREQAVVSSLLSKPEPVTTLEQRIEALLSFDLTRRLSKISLSVLVTCYEDDLVIPKHMSIRLARSLQNSEIRSLGCGGHFGPLYSSEKFIDTLRPFLAGEQDFQSRQDKS